MSQEGEDSQDILHFGNLIGVHSTKYGYTKGRVIYRSADMVRIMPDETSNSAVEFPWDEEGNQFSPDLGVSKVEIFEENSSTYYVDFLGVRPGEQLEFFTLDGEEAAPTGEVEEIIKGGEDDEEDAVKLTDGRLIPFYGVGPPEPIMVVRVSTALNAPKEGEGVGVGVGVEEDAEERAKTEAAEARKRGIAALLRSVLPSAAIEIIPTAERTYPDSMQREGLFQDLLVSLPAKKQANPRNVRLLEREVDLAVSLKNKSVQRDAGGRIIGTAPYQIVTVGDAVAHGGIPSAIPVVQGARVLNLDNSSAEGITYKETDVFPRSLKELEEDLEESATRYLDGAQPEGVSAVNSFYAYTHDLLGRGLKVLEGKIDGSGWNADQDVLRTAAYNKSVEGLSRNLPSAGDDEAPPVSMAFLLSNILDRGMRVLSADQQKIHKTGAVHISAPSDPTHITDYVILPPKAALQLRPPQNPGDLPTALLYSAALEADNLPTIATTLRDLYSSETGSPVNAWTLSAENAGTVQIAEWLKSVLRYTVHPVDSLGPRGQRLLSLLDTLGVGMTDLAPPVADVINKWVSDAQKIWISLMKKRRTNIQAALDTEEPRTFQSVVGVESPLWAALRMAESLKELLEDIGRRNPTIAEAPTLMTAALLVEAQGDATPIVWAEIAKLDSRELAGIDVVSAANALAASRAYVLRRAALRSKSLVAMHAEPEINSCPHTKRLESIRNVGDVLERSRLLRTFIEEFQGPKASTGNWVTCVLCKQNCICYHELMELEALAQPARMDAIQKQILIKYGGDRYEGKIVCKNCGQALQDIDYDEHVEFDDNGKPVQQASVLTDEQMDESTDSTWKKAVVNLAPSEVFETQSHREIAEALTDILTHARLTMPSSVFRRIVTYTDIYTGRRAPDEGKYTELLKKKAMSASTKFKKSTGVEGVTIDLPTFAETIDQLRVSALMALTTIAIQSREVSVSATLPVCTYSQGGFPLVPKAAPDGPGALLYIACATADIKQKKKPWMSMAWTGVTKAESRQKKALGVAYAAINSILGVDEKSVALPFTSQVRMELTKVQTDVEAARERDLVSLKDELPVGFRPEPRPPAVRAPAVERDPLPALAAGPISASTVGEVGNAVRLQAISTIAGLHAATNDSREGMCCPTEISKIIAGADNVQSQLAKAAQMIRQMNPAGANTGTQLWPMLEVPYTEPVEQSVDDGVLFKLFLKYCYQGSAVGNPHEFSVGNICRQCGLKLGKPIDLIDFGKEGAAIMAGQEGGLKIEITRVAFDALSDAARRRKLMRATPALRLADKSGLSLLVELLAARPQTAEIAAVLRPILAKEEVMDEIGRATLWSPLSIHLGTREKAGRIDPTMLYTMTEDPFIEGPRGLQEYWCAKVQAAGASYSVVKVTGARWFDISTKHNDIINGILNENAMWYTGRSVTSAMKPVLLKIAQTLGPILNVWIANVRPDAMRWSIAEAQMLLRTLVVQVWSDALMQTSWMYVDIPSSSDRAAIVEDIRAWTLALMDFKKGPKDTEHKRGHVQTQFIKYSKEAIKRILQQRAELERTSVVEEFDSIKDDDLRAAELIKKQFRIGRWGVGKNLQKYDPDLFEFENEQRKRMGVVEGPVEADAAPQGQGQGQGQGQAVFVEPEEGYEVNQGADGDDY